MMHKCYGVIPVICFFGLLAIININLSRIYSELTVISQELKK